MSRLVVTGADIAIPAIDPHQAASDSFAVVAFPKSPSTNFKLALAIAKSADQFGTWDAEGIPMNVAAFGRSEQSIAKLVALLGYVSSWKGVLYFHSRRITHGSAGLAEVCHCFQQSNRCDDYRAHCHSVIDDPFLPRKSFSGGMLRFVFDTEAEPKPSKEVVIDRYLFPCRRLEPRRCLSSDHPASSVAQIQAASVVDGCDICPRFNADVFKKVGTVIHIVDE